AAARATRAAHASYAGNEPEAAEPAAAAAAATSTSAAASATGATSAAAAAVAAAATASAGHLHANANVFLIEEMERGETDVGHFLFAKNEALIGRGIVGLRDISSWRRGCGCASHQGKTQSGGTQHLHGGGFGCAFLRRSRLDPWHYRILQK